MVYIERDVPTTIDPHAVDTTASASLGCFPEQAYETLVYFPPENAMELVPVLASEVPTSGNGLISDDGLTLTFPLREGVEFHSGREMTAEDVEYSWDRTITMGVSPEAARLADNVESMSVVDDYTFEVTLTSRFAPFLTSVVTRPVATVVDRQAVEDNGGVQEGQPNQWMAQNSAGTGPFKLGTWAPDEAIEWDPHEGYWGESGIDGWRQIARGDLSSRISMIRNGDAHAGRIPADNLSDVEGTPNVKFTFEPVFDPAHLTFNFDIPYDRDNMQDLPDDVPPDFFQDPDVRKGFGFAFNYDAYIREVWSGHAQRFNQYHFPGMLGYDDTAPNFEYDPEQAEEHFRAAGYWDRGFEITCFNEDLAQFADGNLLLKDNIEALNDGFTLNVRNLPESQMVPRHSGDRFEFPLEFHGFLPQGSDPDAYYRPLYSPNGSVGSRSRVELVLNDELDLIDQAATTLDIEERESIYHELQRKCFDNPAVIGITVEELMQTTHECVDNVVLNAGWLQPHFKHWSIDNCSF
jgi:peptide/nickel transport system substrate-binding protein